MHHTVGLGLLILLIGFAFGERVARVIVGAGIVTAALFFAYVMVRIASGTI